MKKVLLIFFLFSLLCFGNNSIENNNAENAHIEKLEKAIKNNDADLARNLFSEFYDNFPQSDKFEKVSEMYQKHLEELEKRAASSRAELQKQTEKMLKILVENDYIYEKDEFRNIVRIRSGLMFKHAPVDAVYIRDFNNSTDSFAALFVVCYSNEPFVFNEVLIKIGDYLYETDVDTDYVEAKKFDYSVNENDKYISSFAILIYEKEEEMLKKLIASKSARIRFSSRKRNVDTDIREVDILNVKRVLELKNSVDTAKKQSQ